MFRSTCLVCRSSDLETIIDLGMHPYADTFITEARLSEPDPFYLLACDLCMSCGHIQTKCITDPEERYSRHDYSYTSSNSSFSRSHWESYAASVSKETGLARGSFVVEIGSNDGYLLEQFLNQGHRVLGVDAAPAMANLARERGIETLVELFNPTTSERIREEWGPAHLVVANNVFNHADDVVGFAKAARDLLARKGAFVFEVPYWCANLSDGRFDQIYHEHVNYFTVRAVEKIMRLSGLSISRVDLVDYHGGSLRVFARREEESDGACQAVQELADAERESKTFQPQKYRDFMRAVCERRNKFLRDFYRRKDAGGRIIGVGAAAKGNTLLNYYRLDRSAIDYITDSSQYKIGKYTPGTRIPVCDDEVFKRYDNVFALILSWNISATLKRKLLSINPKIEWLVP